MPLRHVSGMAYLGTIREVVARVGIPSLIPAVAHNIVDGALALKDRSFQPIWSQWPNTHLNDLA
jgi:hypothetical protein